MRSNHLKKIELPLALAVGTIMWLAMQFVNNRQVVTTLKEAKQVVEQECR